MGAVIPDGPQQDADRQSQVSRDLTTGSIPRHVIAFSTPMLAGAGLQTSYSLINAFWVGQFLGPTALAAVTVSMPVVFTLIAVAAGLTLATNILVAQYVGARDWGGVKGVVQTSVVLAGGVATVLVALGLVFSARLLAVINTPPEILPMAAAYLRIFLLSLPFGFGVFLIGAMLRGIGDSKTPLYFQAVSVALNAVLDPVLMFGWVGFPRLGLNGTALATIIAQGVGVLGLWLYVARKRPLVRPDWHERRVEGATAWLLARIGFPAMIQQSVVSVSMLVIVSLVSGFGVYADAAFGAALRIDQVAFLPALTIGMAVSTLAGQNIGARQYRRVGEVFRWGIALSGGICLAISALAVSVPQILLRAFLNEPEAIAIGVGYLRIVGIGYALFAVMFVSNGVINGAGHTVPTTLMTMITLWGIRLPLAAVLPRYLHSVRGIWWGMLISVACGMALSLGYYVLGRWKRPVVRDG